MSKLFSDSSPREDALLRAVVLVLSSDIRFRKALISALSFSASLLILINWVLFWYMLCWRSVDARLRNFCNACWKLSISWSEASLRTVARYCSGCRFGSLSAFTSTDNPGPFAGAAPRPVSRDEAYWLGMPGTLGTGGAVGSKPGGRLLNRVEYRRLTRSDV